MCRCDEVAYYGVQECYHRGFILGRAPELPGASHRASETPRIDVTQNLNELVSTVDKVGMQVLQARNNNDGSGGT